MHNTICIGCQHGEHHSTDVIQNPPKGALGGSRCRCEGECVDGRYIPPQFKKVIKAFKDALEKEVRHGRSL